MLVSGCGGSKPPSIASVTTTSTPLDTTTTTAAATTTGAGSAAPSSQAQVEEDALKYSQCMRANGVPNFPDPSSGGGFQFASGSGIDPSSPAYQSARAKCQKLLPAGPAPPGTNTHPSGQWLAHMVKVAQCMRAHGVPDFPDPRTSVPSNPFPAGTAGVISNIEGVILIFPSTIDEQSPLFTRAAATCGFPLHNH